jgi:hypothetical protein
MHFNVAEESRWWRAVIMYHASFLFFAALHEGQALLHKSGIIFEMYVSMM